MPSVFTASRESKKAKKEQKARAASPAPSPQAQVQAQRTAASYAPPEVQQEELWDQHVNKTLNELQRIYLEEVLPIEDTYNYTAYKPGAFINNVRQKKPMVTFLGPYSSGKSTFINYLIQSNDAMKTGPQPVTDKFTVVMYGEREQEVSGNVLMNDPTLPFKGLQSFGDDFKERLSGYLYQHPLLKSINLIDTPGVLESAGTLHRRSYDYVKVCQWFVEMSDLVIFLFDPTKLDTGSELRSIFDNAIRNNVNKVRLVLNKADMVKPQELMRIYGSLYWNLSNLVNTSEPPRVYISSFWDRPYEDDTDHDLFDKEKQDLLFFLTESVPMQSVERRITVLERRTSDVLGLALATSEYKSKTSSMFGRDKAKKEFFKNYDVNVVKKFVDQYNMSVKSIPTSEDLQRYVQVNGVDNVPDAEKLVKKSIPQNLRNVIEVELPALLEPLKQFAVSDPRNRQRAMMLKREYFLKQQEQQLLKTLTQQMNGTMNTTMNGTMNGTLNGMMNGSMGMGAVEMLGSRSTTPALSLQNYSTSAYNANNMSLTNISRSAPAANPLIPPMGMIGSASSTTQNELEQQRLLLALRNLQQQQAAHNSSMNYMGLQPQQNEYITATRQQQQQEAQNAQLQQMFLLLQQQQLMQQQRF